MGEGCAPHWALRCLRRSWRDPRAGQPSPRRERRQAGQVVVGFRANADPVTRRLVVADQDAKTVDSIPQLGAQVVRVDGSVQGAIASFEANPAVAYAEPNWIYRTEAVPNDPRYSQDYGLPKIQAPQAWDVTTGSAAVTVAVTTAVAFSFAVSASPRASACPTRTARTPGPGRGGSRRGSPRRCAAPDGSGRS